MSKISFCKDLVLHRIKAKNRHGLHSPFVYRLVDNVFYDYHTKKVYPEIEKINKDLFATQKTLETGLKALKVNRLLYRLAVDLKPVNLVLLGLITPDRKLYLQRAAPDASICTDVLNCPGKLDFVLIKEAEKEQALKYFEDCLPKVHDTTMVIFDRIYQNKDIKKAWQEIKANPQVTVTIDLFWLGLVFFRKGQVKEDFLIKF